MLITISANEDDSPVVAAVLYGISNILRLRQHGCHFPDYILNSCGDTCQIWAWYSIADMYFGDVEKIGK